MFIKEGSMEKINNDRICVGLAGFGLSGRFFQAPFLHSDTRFNLKKSMKGLQIIQNKSIQKLKL